MSFLNFLFRERGDKDESASPAVLDVEPPQPEDVDAVETEATSAVTEELADEPEAGPVYGNEPASSDLESIRAALLKIAEVIHDDDEAVEEQEDSSSLSVVELTAEQIADLIPGVFKAGAAEDVSSERTFGVRVPDLFEQLRTGKVVTAMSRVLTEIPAEWLARPAQSMSRDEVSIPLHLAVSAVRADELVKRTPTVERNPELKDMPNLFSMGGPPKAPPSTESLFGAAPPRAEETTIKQPLPEATKPGLDMFERAAESPAASRPAASRPPTPSSRAAPGAKQGFVFEFNEAATPFRRADEVKDEIADEESAKKAAAPQAPVPPEAPAPNVPEPQAKAPEAPPPVSKLANPFAPMPEAANLFAPATPPPPKAEPAPKADKEPAPAAPEPAPPAKPPVETPAPEPAANAVKPREEKGTGKLAVLPERADGVQLHGVDLNTADEERMVDCIPGVGVRMAARIVRYRNQQGPFTCIQDLVNVPGIGPSTYEKMTGASWSEARDELRRVLDHLLGRSRSAMPDLRAVAARFARQPGFSGCILVHKDGHVLAADWPDNKAEVVGAIAPQLFKKVAPYVEQLGFGEVNPVTLCFGEDVLTLVYSGEILIGTLHEIGRLDKNQLRLIQLAGAELEDRMERTKLPQDP